MAIRDDQFPLDQINGTQEFETLDYVRLAQLEGGEGETDAPIATQDEPAEPAQTPQPAPETLTVAIEDGFIARLPEGASIEQPRVNGTNLEFVQPDGTVIVITNGAIAGFTLFLGSVEIPAQALAALFDANGLDIAAGPEGPDTQPGSGGNFSQPVGGIGDGIGFGGLLDPTALNSGNLAPELNAYGEVLHQINTFYFGGFIEEGDLSSDGRIAGLSYITLAGDGNGWANGEDGWTVSGNLSTLVAGAQGTLNFFIAPAINGTAALDTAGNPLTSLGDTVNYVVQSDGVVLGLAEDGSRLIFRLTLNQDGTFKFELNDQIDHLGANGNQLNLNIASAISVTDGLSTITLTGEIIIPILDDAPLPTQTATLALDEDALLQGDDETEGGHTITGKLPIGADGGDPNGPTGQMTVFFDSVDGQPVLDTQGNPVTSGGQALYFHWSAEDGGILIGSTGEGQVIFTLHDINHITGAFKFTLSGPIDHPEKGAEDNLQLNIAYRLTDYDGDTATSQLRIDIDDDVPVAYGAGTRDLQEEANADGTFIASSVNGTLPFDQGADGATVTNVAYRFGGTIMDMDAPGGFPALESNGVPVTIVSSVSGGVITLTGTAGDTPVFTFTIQPNGSYTFTLQGPIDHPDHGQSGTADELRMVFDYTVTDTDGDTSTSWIQIDIRDDAPILIAEGDNRHIVNEDDINTQWGPFGSTGTSPNDGPWDGSFTGSPWTNWVGAATIFGSVGNMVDFGADGGSFSITDAGIDYFETLGLSSKGEDLSYAIHDGTLIAFVGFRPVFTFSIDAESGNYTFKLYDQLDHDAPFFGKDQNFDLQDGIAGDVVWLDFGQAITATDGDGDAVSLDGHVKIAIRDDVPELVGYRKESVTVDEQEIRTIWSQGTQPDFYPDNVDGNDSFTSIFTGAATVTGSLAGLVRSGADESLEFSFINAHAIRFALSDLGLQSKGQQLSYEVRGNTLIAFVDADGHGLVFNHHEDRPVFTLSLEANGSYRFSLIDQLDHDWSKGQNSDLVDREPGDVSALDFGSIIKATDHDGDSVTLGGAFKITIKDDVPELAEGRTIWGVVEEEHLPGGNEDTSAAYPFEWLDFDLDAPWNAYFTTNVAMSFFSGDLSQLVVEGADDGGRFHARLGVRGDEVEDASGRTVTSGGHAVTIEHVWNWNGITGFLATANGQPVFTLFVNENGEWVFTLQGPIDHHPYDGADNLEDMLAIDLSGLIRYTDFDGDSVPLGNNSFIIKVLDDTPEANGATSSVTVHENDLDNADIGSLFDLFDIVEGSAGTSPDGDTQGPIGGLPGLILDPIFKGSTSAQGTLQHTVDFGADGFGGFHFRDISDDLAPLWSKGETVEYARLTVGGTSFVFGYVSDAADDDIDLVFEALGDILDGQIPSWSDALGAAIRLAGSEFRLVFGLGVKQDGNYEFRLFDQLDHAASGHGDHALTIDFSGLFEVRDGDGDAVDLATGSLNVIVKDDEPLAAAELNGDELRLDESVGSDADDTNADDEAGALASPYQSETVIGYATGKLLEVNASQSGADEEATISYTFAVIDSATKLLDTGTGHSIVLVETEEDGHYLVTGYAGEDGGPLVFAIQLNRTTGEIGVWQYRAIKHDTADHDESNAPLSLPENLLKIIVTVTDNDGDADSETVDIGHKIVFEDDGPAINGVTYDEFGPELIVNGGFENGHGLSGNNWDIFNSIDGWTKGDNVPFEVQTGGAGGVPGNDTSVVELDSDTQSNGNPGSAPSHSYGTEATIQQVVNGTVEGQAYQLTFSYAPRGETAGLQVFFGGVKVFDSAEHDYAPGQWHTITVSAPATTDNAVLAFTGTGTPDEIGALIDNVSLRAVLDGLDDENQPSGIEGGPGDDASGRIVSGKIDFDAGLDGLASIAFSDELDLQAIFVDENGVGHSVGVDVVWTPTGVGGTLVGSMHHAGETREVFELVVNADGSFKLTLKAPLDHPLAGGGDFEGAYEDNITLNLGYTITDGDGDFATGTLNLAIDDDTPLARGDTFAQTSENTAVIGNVLADTGKGEDEFGADGQGTPAVALVENSLTGSGTLILDPNGNFTYTPSAGEEGNVSFEYTITDGDGDISTAKVTITLEPDSKPTVAVTSGTVSEAGLPQGTDPESDGETITGTFSIGTGGDAIGALEIHNGGGWVDVTAATAGNPVTVNGAKGVLTVTSDGAGNYSWSYTLNTNLLTHDDNENGSDGDSDRGEADQQHGDAFAVRVTDSDGDISATDTLQITVNDDGPVFTDGGIEDAAVEALNTAVSGDLNISFGADGENADDGLVITGWPTIEGVFTHLSEDGRTLTAYIGDNASGTALYTLTLGVDGYTFTQHAPLPGVAGKLPVVPTLGGESAASIDFGGFAITSLTTGSNMHPTGDGLGIGKHGGGHIEDGESFRIDFDQDMLSLDLDVDFIGGGNNGAIELHWVAYKGGVLVPAPDGEGTVTFNSDGTVTIDPTGGIAFDRIEITANATGGKENASKFRITSVGGEAEGTVDIDSLSFTVTGTDGDGDSVSDSFEVALPPANEPPSDIRFNGNAELTAAWRAATFIPHGAHLFTATAIDPDTDGYQYSFNGNVLETATDSSGLIDVTLKTKIDANSGEAYLDDGRIGIPADDLTYFTPQSFTFGEVTADAGEEHIQEAVTLRLGTTPFNFFGATKGGGDTIDGSDSDHDQVIYGFGGKDELTGGSGDDWISGGEGKDFLVGGDGKDILIGGDGADVFYFAESGSDNIDTIEDYVTGEDVIDLSALLGDDVNQGNIEDHVDVDPKGGNTVLSIDGEQVVALKDHTGLGDEVTILIDGHEFTLEI